MRSEFDPCYPNEGVHHRNQLYIKDIDMDSGGDEVRGSSETQLRSFLCSLSLLKEKVNQVQSYVNIVVPQSHQTIILDDGSSSSAMAIATMGTVIQEIIVTASSMMFNCQQMGIISPNNNHNNHNNQGNNPNHHHHHIASSSTSTRTNTNNNNCQSFFDGEGLYNWYSDNNNNIMCTTTATTRNPSRGMENSKEIVHKNNKDDNDNTNEEDAYDIVEIDASDLLAKYTHYCQVCGKGFKRDANLRMHMRAHGDEYKSSEALSNPLKKAAKTTTSNNKVVPNRMKYSCPHEGCRWNKKHVKFQPLKSVICVKNHYRRSHCPKMYVCKRCNRKQFSVLSDLRTHEKHCGDVKWQCSCGSNFSRKDKLMGHVALFLGHSPILLNNPTLGNNTLDNHHHKVENNNLYDNHSVQIVFKDS